MRLLVPFAAPWSDAGRRALQQLSLPQLERLLPRLCRRETDEGDEYSLTPPHERALARALGLAGADGCLPWAARAAQQAGLDTGDLAWGLLTPVHLHLGTEQVTLIGPSSLALGDESSRAFFDDARPLFTGEGMVLHWLAADAWLVAHESLRELPTASLDRVVGRNIDRWLPDAPAARLLRRLQNEVQMLLYTHALNDEREARGLPTVNSLWLSGCGPAQPDATGEAPPVDDRLRRPALDEDWDGWSHAWQALDAGPIAALAEAARRGDAVNLTLCGERRAMTLTTASRSLWQRWRSPSRERAADVMETL